MSTRSQPPKSRSRRTPPRAQAAIPALKQPPRLRRRSPALTATCLIFALAAVIYAGWSWHQSTRPGMTRYLKGLDYAAARQFGQAQAEWQLGISEDPSSPQCWEQLGDIYAQAHQYVQAAHCYEQTTHLLPHDGMQFLQLARMEQALGNSPAATAAAQSASTLMPKNVDALALYGSLEADQNNRPAALDALRRAFALSPQRRAVAIPLAYMDLRVTDRNAAIGHLTPYLQAHPEDSEACYLMAFTLLQQPPAPDTLWTALDYAKRAQRGQPRDTRVYIAEGNLYLRLNQPHEALLAFQAGERVEPYSEEILEGIVRSKVRLGLSQKADATAAELHRVSTRHNRIQHLLDLNSIGKGDIATGLELARLQEEEGDYRFAQMQFEQLVRQAPHDPRTHAGLAAFLRRMGRPDLAKQAASPNFVP